MGVDPMALVNAARPAHVAVDGTALRRMRDTVIEDHEGRARDVNELATRPGTKAYQDKIPLPPCAGCGADHNPVYEMQNRYGHPYLHPDEAARAQELQASGLAVPSVAPSSPPIPVAAPVPPLSGQRRVSIMPARNDSDFIVGVEGNPPDWDLEDSWKLSADVLLQLLPILRLLEIKIRDNTGGDLKSLELEHGRS